MSVKDIFQLAKKPLADDREIQRVEIIILKFKEEKEVIDECVSRVIHHTNWPFKLNIFDNRPNSANTSKIWNKLIRESTCDYVLFLDSDAFIPKESPCWLTRMMESIDESGIVLPMGDNVGGDNKATGPEKYPSVQEQQGIWSGFCFLLKKDIVEKMGWFDEDFYFYGQDSEFAHRCLRKNKAIYRKDVFVRHISSYSGKKAEQEGEFDRESDKLYAQSLYRLRTKK